MWATISGQDGMTKKKKEIFGLVIVTHTWSGATGGRLPAGRWSLMEEIARTVWHSPPQRSTGMTTHARVNFCLSAFHIRCL